MGSSITIHWPVILRGAGVLLLAVCALGLLWTGRGKLFGWLPRMFSRKGTAPPATDPDRRKEFTDRLHWLTEFARNDLQSQEMVDDLDNVHRKFTAIRRSNVDRLPDDLLHT